MGLTSRRGGSCSRGRVSGPAPGRSFTSADDEWEFSYASPTPRDGDRIEVELRDTRTNRLVAKDDRKAKIAWK